MQRPLILLLLCLTLLAACDNKNSGSKIPRIALLAFGPDSVYLTPGVQDTVAALEFSLADADGDIGVDSSTSAIFIMDSRFDSIGYVKFPFPASLTASIEDPKKGLTGTCIYAFAGDQALSLRSDSLHQAAGDTANFYLFITDRAGHHSDTIVTPRLIMRP